MGRVQNGTEGFVSTGEYRRPTTNEYFEKYGKIYLVLPGEESSWTNDRNIYVPAGALAKSDASDIEKAYAQPAYEI